MSLFRHPGDHLRNVFSQRLDFASSWPWWLLLLASLIIFSPLIEGGTTHVAVMVIRLLILSVFGLYLWNVGESEFVSWPSLRINPAVLSYLGLAIIATVRSPYLHQSYQWLVVLFSYSLLLYTFVFLVNEWNHLIKLLVILVGMGIFEACLTILQAAWAGSIRPHGTFFNPNFLAEYLAAIFLIILGHLCYVQFRHYPKDTSWFFRLNVIAPVAVLAVLLSAIVWTGSRGGAAALIIGTLLVVGIRFGRKGIGILLLLITISLLFSSPLHQRIEAEHLQNPVTYARWQMWQSSVFAMRDHPLGSGLGLYQYIYPNYAFPVEGQIARYGKAAHTAHNEYLQMGVELGPVSILVFCWGVITVYREALWILKWRLRRWQRGIIVGVLGAYTTVLVHAAVDSNLHEPALALLLILCVGIVVSVKRMLGGVTEKVFAVPTRSCLLWMSLCAVLIVGMGTNVIQLGVGWIFFESGNRALVQRDFTQAIHDYRTAILLDSGKALYHSSMAAAYFQIFERTRDLEVAQTSVTELKSAVALNPLDGRLLGLLGHVYMTLASLPSDLSYNKREDWLRLALSAYQKAAELEPFTPFHDFQQGHIYLALGYLDQAETLVRRSIELEPNFLPAREWLAKRYLNTHRDDLAEQELREILERQRRYAGLPKSDLEKLFLIADTKNLQEAMFKERARS